MTLIPFSCRRLIGVWLLLCVCSAQAQLTDNHVLHAVPASGAVAVDGRLDDWDLSGRIFCCPDMEHLRNTASAHVAMMYDAKALYVAVDWIDASPMLNNYDPRFDQRFCFHSDSLQLHFKTDLTRQVFGWYYTRAAQPAVIATDGERWYDHPPIAYIDGMKDLGITEAFSEKPDHSGYVQEMRIPWTALYQKPTTPKAGDRIACMLDLVWGPAAGKGWPAAHVMDLVQPGAAHGDWFWNVHDIRGQIVLESQGHLQLPDAKQQAGTSGTSGTSGGGGGGPVLVRADIPLDARRFTLAINDRQGRRVRNLAGDFDAESYTIARTATSRTVQVGWDCLDDNGKLAAAGTYNVLGLCRGELTATYDMSFYNPGSPPWETRNGTGGWGADHTPPSVVATTGDMIAIGWASAEGGSGVIGVGADGRKKWGALKGATALAGDERYVYVMTSDAWAGTSGLGRLRRSDGIYEPYLADGKAEFPLPLSTVFAGRGPVPGNVTAMAVHGKTLVLAMSQGQLVFLDADTAKIHRIAPLTGLPEPKALAWGEQLVMAAGGGLYVVPTNDAADAKPRRVELPGLGGAGAVTFAQDGRLAVADVGPDSQVKFYDLKDRRLVGAFGKKGGRALRGAFDPQAMAHVSSIAFDAAGNLWVAENGEFPRRVSVWGDGGRLLRDYLGNTAYCACGTYLHDSDPTLAYDGPMEFKLDRANHTWALHRILWAPNYAAGESFLVAQDIESPRRFRSDASGKMHEYLYSHNGPQVVYMQCGAGGAWQPVAAIFLVHQVSGRLNANDFSGKSDRPPEGEFAGLNLRDGVVWSDRNGDGKIQRSECAIVPAEGRAVVGHKVDGHGPAAKLKMGDGWGGRMGGDLSIYAAGVVRYKPAGFSDDGAPIYDLTSIQPMNVNDYGDLVPLDNENKLLICSATGYGQTSYLRAVELTTGRELWRYPLWCHGVHGSHAAGMPEPGKPIGVIKLLGTAYVSKSAGTVVALRGNLGQDFLLTSDGLYVGAMFHDCRIPSPPLPATEQALYGADMSEASEGSEPFNGWFGRQDDGAIRLCNGMAGLAGTILTIHGLDSIQRFDAPPVTFDEATRVLAEQQSAAQVQTVRSYTLHRLAAAAAVTDDKPFSFPADIPAMDIGGEGNPNRSRLRLGYDEKNLYVQFDVRDDSPLLNEGRDFTRLFKTGDACDLQLSTDPAAAQPHTDPVAGDLRLVFSKLNDGRLVCVLMQPVDPHTPPDKRCIYGSPVGTRTFARVEILPQVRLWAEIGKQSYTLRAAVPLEAIGLRLKPGMILRGDGGVIHSDAQGRIDVARTYWSNPYTSLVSDLPHEAWLYPAAWGQWKVE